LLQTNYISHEGICQQKYQISYFLNIYFPFLLHFPQKNRPTPVFDDRADQADIRNPLFCLIQLNDGLLYRADYYIIPITV